MTFLTYLRLLLFISLICIGCKNSTEDTSTPNCEGKILISEELGRLSGTTKSTYEICSSDSPVYWKNTVDNFLNMITPLTRCGWYDEDDPEHLIGELFEVSYKFEEKVLMEVTIPDGGSINSSSAFSLLHIQGILTFHQQEQTHSSDLLIQFDSYSDGRGGVGQGFFDFGEIARPFIIDGDENFEGYMGFSDAGGFLNWNAIEGGGISKIKILGQLAEDEHIYFFARCTKP